MQNIKVGRIYFAKEIMVNYDSWDTVFFDKISHSLKDTPGIK